MPTFEEQARAMEVDKRARRMMDSAVWRARIVYVLVRLLPLAALVGAAVVVALIVALARA